MVPVIDPLPTVSAPHADMRECRERDGRKQPQLEAITHGVLPQKCRAEHYIIGDAASAS
jgi:hypothetical protein